MEVALAEANKLHRERRYHRLAHMLSAWLTRVCDSKTAWFAEQLSTELRAIADCRRSDCQQYIRERVTDALSYFEWRACENKSWASSRRASLNSAPSTRALVLPSSWRATSRDSTRTP